MKQLTRMFCLLGITAIGTSCMVGCASTPPPKELQDARAAYQSAATSPGAVRAQADIAEAKQSLDSAEASFKDDPKGKATLDGSYIASRKSESARAKANALTVLEEKKALDLEVRGLRAQRDAAQRAEIAQTKAMAQGERQARLAAEQKTRDALMAMGAMQTDRGLVLTLSGSVLFASGKSVLLPAAQARLKEAAQALKEDGRPFTIMGHTDSTGSDELNQKLSLARAEAVRSYLVSSAGIPADKVTAEGKGESMPLTDNATAEGRANNRRVEIVVANGAAK